MASVPKKPGLHKVGGRFYRRLANGKVKFAKAPPGGRSASVTRRAPRSPAKTAAPRRRKKTMPSLKTMVDTDALIGGAIGGAAANFGSNLLGPTIGGPLGLAVGGAVAKKPATKAALHAMAGVALGSNLLGATGLPGAGAPSRGVL